MSVNVYEKTAASSDGIHTLYGKIYVPESSNEIRGIVQVVHGKSEHIDRYERFMTALAENGYAAFGHKQDKESVLEAVKVLEQNPIVWGAVPNYCGVVIDA